MSGMTKQPNRTRPPTLDEMWDEVDGRCMVCGRYLLAAGPHLRRCRRCLGELRRDISDEPAKAATERR